MSGPNAEPIRVLYLRTDADAGRTTAKRIESAREQFTVESTANVDAALDAPLATFDCIACEHRPPSLDALAFLRDVRTDYPALPVVVVAPEDADADVEEDAFRNGATDYAGGASRAPVLAHRIERAVRMSDSRADARDESSVIEALNEATQRLIAAETPREVGGVASDVASDVLDFPGTGVRVYNSEDETLESISISGSAGDVDSRPPYDVRDSPHGEAFLQEELVIDDIGDDDPYDREIFSQTMYLPIAQYGVLSVGKKTGTFSDRDVRLSKVLANTTESAFERAYQKKRRDVAVERIDEIADEIVAASDSFATTAEVVERSSREVTDAIGGISNRADDQSEQLQTVLEEINGLSASVEEIAASADEVAELADETVALARTGSERAENATAEMETLRKRTDRFTEDIRDLAEAVGRASEIVEMIDEIADRTNILALNASIEAARAGEDGSGFAVVADEVKELAEETKESTDEIEEIIDEVIRRTDEFVDEIEEMRSSVDSGVETVDDALGALEDIAEKVENTTTGAMQISDATDEQATATEEVVAIVEDVVRVSEETASEARDVVETTDEQTESVAEVARVASDLETRAEELRDVLETRLDDEDGDRDDQDDDRDDASVAAPSADD